MHTGNWRIAYRTVAAAALTALILPSGSSFAQEEGGANAAEAAMQQRSATTFRLLTFEVGTSGPRLGTTRGNGTEDIVDVHNAIRYLKSVGEARAWAPIPIDMLALVEAGAPSIEAVKSVHRAITRA